MASYWKWFCPHDDIITINQGGFAAEGYLYWIGRGGGVNDDGLDKLYKFEIATKTATIIDSQINPYSNYNGVYYQYGQHVLYLRAYDSVNGRFIATRSEGPSAYPINLFKQYTLEKPAYWKFSAITNTEELTIKYVKNATASKNLLGSVTELVVDNFNYVGFHICHKNNNRCFDVAKAQKNHQH